jgi:hypothetical protein
MAASPVSSYEAFERSISSDFLTLTSVCKTCGTSLSGTASDGLAEREIEHMKTCAQAAKKLPRSVDEF